MSSQPAVWVLHGAHVGDNAQTVHLAEALGLPFQIKPLRYNLLHAVPFLLRGTGLASLTADSRALIAPPWPRLVIAAGKRSAPVALHIRQASGGATRLVQLGRPRAPLELFDLVVTTPQYGLPPSPNVLELPLPFARSEATDPQELEHWSAAWAALPRPLVAVMVGARSFPQRFGATEAVALAGRLAAGFPGGSLLVIGSPRTRTLVLSVLAERLGSRALVYRYGARRNPYRAALALADRIVVTSDSMSMLADAIVSGKPVSIYTLPVSPLALRWSAAGGPMAALARRGILTPPRDMTAIVRRLVADGHADLLGAETPGQHALTPDYGAVLDRVRGLQAGL